MTIMSKLGAGPSCLEAKVGGMLVPRDSKLACIAVILLRLKIKSVQRGKCKSCSSIEYVKHAEK